MSRVATTRPIPQKTAIMTVKEERRFMDSFRDTICEVCGLAEGVVPCHVNLGLGGTGYRAKGIVAGLCSRPGGCHDILDRRSGTDRDRAWVLEKLAQKLLRDRAKAWSDQMSHSERPEDGS